MIPIVGVRPGTELPRLEDGRFGDGHAFRCNTDGSLIKEYATATHGGMPAFLGICSSTLAPDGKTYIYLSELGTCLDNGRQEPPAREASIGRRRTDSLRDLKWDWFM